MQQDNAALWTKLSSMHLPPFVPKNVLKKILFSKGQKITDRIKVKTLLFAATLWHDERYGQTGRQTDKQIRRRERNWERWLLGKDWD